MKAIVYHDYGAPDVLQLQDVERPEPRAGELLVRVLAASVNPADGFLMRGRPYLTRLTGGWTRPKVKGLGLDFAGIVSAVGPGQSSFSHGDAVFGEIDAAGTARSFAEHICVAADRVVRKPDCLSFEQAAAVPLAGCTALYAVRDYGQVGPGQRVLINGAGGGVGTYAVQLAKHFGAEVTAVSSEEKMHLLKGIGADHVVDYRKRDFTAESTHYDVIIDIVSSQSVARCRRVLAPRGRFVWVGGPNTNPWLGPARYAINVLLNSLISGKQRLVCVAETARVADLVVLSQLLADGKLRPVIGRTYPLARVADAIRYIEQGHACGKVVIEVAYSS